MWTDFGLAFSKRRVCVMYTINHGPVWQQIELEYSFELVCYLRQSVLSRMVRISFENIYWVNYTIKNIGQHGTETKPSNLVKK